jgi:hypothetical protein
LAQDNQVLVTYPGVRQPAYSYRIIIIF